MISMTQPQRILIIQGHPDASQPHLCHALAEAYAAGARESGHEVRMLEVAALDFPLLRSQREWESGTLPSALGDMPALLKGFLEQVARPGFAFSTEGGDGAAFSRKGLTGRSARIVVTMGMPSLLYRWYFRAHSIKSLERNILGFVGIAPVSATLVGAVAQLDGDAAMKHLQAVRRLGAQAK